MFDVTNESGTEARDVTTVIYCLNRDGWETIYVPTSVTLTRVRASGWKRGGDQRIHASVMFTSLPIRAGAHGVEVWLCSLAIK